MITLVFQILLGLFAAFLLGLLVGWIAHLLFAKAASVESHLNNDAGDKASLETINDTVLVAPFKQDRAVDTEQQRHEAELAKAYAEVARLEAEQRANDASIRLLELEQANAKS